ncbi:MAG: PTS sugar transporter subunit IIA [Candidatus Omnitrophica bacterium]|nr:PTS sugar transporter subunit IIA [Candidatus Omnitrophota bacterium]
MNLADNLRDGRILISIEGRTKADILKSMIAVLENQEIISNSEKLFADFLDRESKGSTGIGNGIAIPRSGAPIRFSRLEYVFANSVEGVDFESLDGEPVHILFLMVAPAGSHGIHIKALARISRILNDEGTRVRLRKATTPDEIIQLIRDREEELG